MKRDLITAAIVAAAACALYAQQPAATKAAPGIKVEKIATAASVENREPVGEAAAFGKGTTRVYTWTKITAAQTPAKIKHVYYADGKKVAEVELPVNSSPYRVWSSKTVWPGNWKVEVTDTTGAALAVAEFSVSDAKTAVEPAAAK